MPIRPPTTEDIRELGDDLDLDLTPEEIEFFHEQFAEDLESYETIRSYDPEPRGRGEHTRPRNTGT